MPILYYDCFAGISGDMNLGALVDLGVDVGHLKAELEKLQVPGFTLGIVRDIRGGISGTKVDVQLDGAENHHHRSFRDIQGIIQKSPLSEAVKDRSIRIFGKIAEAEGKIHGKPAEDVGFHEVGAVDSIVDIVGAAICLESLKVDEVYSSGVELGGGFVQSAHGKLPVPAPATLEILKGGPVRKGIVPFETTTPTGAAILAATVREFTDRLSMRVDGIGYGLGTRQMEIPNVLRVLLGERGEADSRQETAVMVECNIDDMSPERYEYVADQLWKAGARDVFFTPTIMKKSRPAVILSALCTEEQAAEIKAVIFSHTTTLGVREHRVLRNTLAREVVTCRIPYGQVRVKKAYFRGKLVHSKPEYDDCRQLAEEHGVGLDEIYREVEKALRSEPESDKDGVGGKKGMRAHG